MNTLKVRVGQLLLIACLFLGANTAQADRNHGDGYHNGGYYRNGLRGYYDGNHHWFYRQYYHNHYGYFNGGTFFIRID